ncbi:hypothetical protein [Asticcacaulis sp. EMRT-3]|uniref:hypothetical protein n=1 Tax=Asticcacaulis sp. EMRT-3 TaxID=3040349 RepID=UPI0024AEC43C|nr:hypothetical protein [Asticcacaulis sp. EMRT-3]MDI7773963.1 hypothetical protein [Asticcacaulis sp. EMRT-3]
MDRDYNKLLAKLDRPPSGHNWSRFVHDGDVTRTTKEIVAFVKGVPKITYVTGSSAIRDRIQFGIDLETAINVTRRGGAPAGRIQNENLVRAFFEYDAIRRYTSCSYIEAEREWFRVSREVSVPVSPLAVVREKGQFVPVFLCGWSELKLTHFQRRLLVTIYEDAFLSLTDFQSSPAEFLFFPNLLEAGKKKRVAEVWQRGDYQLLTGAELNRAIEVFLDARELARVILLEEMAKAKQPEMVATSTSTSLSTSLDIFDSSDK